MAYLDTGCLVKLYYPEPDSGLVAKDGVVTEFRFNVCGKRGGSGYPYRDLLTETSRRDGAIHLDVHRSVESV